MTIPGRFLVFMPTVEHIGVSRKIGSREQRVRLRRIVREFRSEHGMPGGVIIRTAAADRPKEDIISDLTYFHELWTETQQKGETRRAPAVIHREESLVAKLLRDLLTDDFSAIRIDDLAEFKKAVVLVERIMAGPGLQGAALRQELSDPSRNTACRRRSTKRYAARFG